MHLGYNQKRIPFDTELNQPRHDPSTTTDTPFDPTTFLKVQINFRHDNLNEIFYLSMYATEMLIIFLSWVYKAKLDLPIKEQTAEFSTKEPVTLLCLNTKHGKMVDR